MKQLLDLLGPLGCRLPIERLYRTLRYYLSPIEPAQPLSLSYLGDGLQQRGDK